MLLLIGGTDTTRNSMTGLVVGMNRFPGEWQALKDDASLIPNAGSELIRWQTPLAHMRRTATEDTELGGRRIAKGDQVVLRSEEHTSELQSLMRMSYAVFCL